MPASRDHRWVPVRELSPLARALLSEDLGGRDVVPRHVAGRAAAQADEWAAHGFTDQTVRPWKDAPPAAAAYLAARGVDPRVLDLPIDVYAGTAPVSLRSAICSGRMPVERAYELLVLTGQHQPPAATPPQPPAATPPQPRHAIAPVIFSHAQETRW
jgi:hypothetical protein